MAGAGSRQTARLAWRFLRCDIAAGRLGTLAAALAVAVAAVTAVDWLAERVGAATTQRAAELIAADRVVRTDEPIPEAWLAQARQRGLAAARTVVFPTVAVAGERSQLVSLKAVEPGYPLRGELRVAAAPGAADQPAAGGPPPGRVWVAPRLLALLDTELGERLRLGDRALPMARLVTAEPDRAGPFGALAPRALVAWETVQETGLLGRGSRVRYSLLLAGEPEALAAYAAWLREAPGPEREVVRGEEAQPGIRRAVERAERFLGLAALLTVVVAAAAVLLTARHYAAAQLDRIAVLRVLGAGQGRIVAVQALILAAVALAAGALGTGAGFLLHHAMLALLGELLPPQLPGAGPGPALYGVGFALLAAGGFALPTVLRLRRVPPVRVLRRSAGAGALALALPYLVAAA
ncbi:ABC transporter permease, partial [Halorhodospira neutriphila]|nr:hypothetical protein [Halorhodospira neutriphila]